MGLVVSLEPCMPQDKAVFPRRRGGERKRGSVDSDMGFRDSPVHRQTRSMFRCFIKGRGSSHESNRAPHSHGNIKTETTRQNPLPMRKLYNPSTA